MRLLAILLLSAAFAAFGSESQLPELAVPTAENAATIDGVLDDDLWKAASAMEPLRRTNAEAANVKSRVLISQDARALYIAVEAFESPEAMAKLKTAVRDHDEDNIWEDDSVELFIDPTGTRRTFYQMIINASGVYWDGFHDGVSRGADKTWQPQCQVAVKKSEDRWTLELRLPWTAFTRTDDFSGEWAFNLVRNSTVSSEAAYWSPVLGKSNLSPQRFGVLRGIVAKK